MQSGQFASIRLVWLHGFVDPRSKDHVLRLRVDGQSRRAYIAAARRAGKSVSQWIRELADRELAALSAPDAAPQPAAEKLEG